MIIINLGEREIKSLTVLKRHFVCPRQAEQEPGGF